MSIKNLRQALNLTDIARLPPPRYSKHRWVVLFVVQTSRVHIFTVNNPPVQLQQGDVVPPLYVRVLRMDGVVDDVIIVFATLRKIDGAQPSFYRRISGTR